MKVKKPKLLAHERVLMKALSKRLPVEAHVHLSYYRGLSWSEAYVALGMRPEPHQTMNLRITMHGEERSFEWKGASLQEGVAQLDIWLSARKALTVSAQVKALPAAQLALAEASV